MTIQIKTNAKLRNFEAKLDLIYRRKRLDYRNLLVELKQGRKITDIFPKSVANNIIKRLLSLKLLDEGNSVTQKGESFIKDPELPETETGSFSVSNLQYTLGSNQYNLIPEMRRKLSRESRKLSPNPISGFVKENQLILDQEIVSFDTMKYNGQANKVYISEEPKDYDLIIDLYNDTYSFGSKSLMLGNELRSTLVSYVLATLEGNPYGDFDFNLATFILTNGIRNLSIKEILEGKIESISLDALSMSNIPFVIDDVETAKEYLYKVAYSKLQHEDYYSISDLNDIYINELFDNGVFSDAVKKEMFDFTYEINGFNNYLSKKEYESLQYKLNVLEFLLGFSLLEENTDFAKAGNYKELVKTFNTYVPSKQVDSSYIVMGYPFARNTRNKFREFFNEFSKVYKDAAIVKKGNKQKVDFKMEETFEKLDVPIYELDTLREHYHDRYIIFKLKNNQYKVFLITSEIGQFFKENSTDKMGLVKELDYQEIKRSNRKDNLVEIIERGIANA